ncbi:MAG: hypothetical protein M3451_04050 [Chloroflexota bacterium]|nr:hypothetical protein [Chloroflexota bacterium]
MGLGPFVIISLIYAVIGVRSIARTIKSWEQVWGRTFSLRDRQMVDEAAFFALVPVSVALHELGHAVAIWTYGGEVEGFGFYGFAGYVSFFPIGFTEIELTMVAAAGSIVNLALCAIALGLVFLRRNPFRAAINELLIQFAIISGANAFILYPLLDLASNMNGDWRQMYTSDVPWLTGIIVAVQVGVVACGYWLFTSPKVKARMAELTDVPAGMERGLLGGVRPGAIDVKTLSPQERVLRDATERVQSGWSSKVETGLQRFDGGTAMTVTWQRNSQTFAVAVRTFANNRTDVVALNTHQKMQNARPRLIHAWPMLPSADELTMALRMAMESLEQGSA